MKARIDESRGEISGEHSRRPVRKMVGPIAVVLVVAAVLLTLHGCSVTGTSTKAAPSLRSSAELIFLDSKPTRVRRDYADHYACRFNLPIICTCPSLLSHYCVCRC
jgi:hypothetical protein